MQEDVKILRDVRHWLNQVLPSEPVSYTHLDVYKRQPVEHAYELLCEEGYAEARARSGYFVIYQKDDFISNRSEWDIEPLPLNRTHEAKSDFPYTVLAKTCLLYTSRCV